MLESVSLPDKEGNYFVPPRCIQALINLDPKSILKDGDGAQEALALERQHDQNTKRVLALANEKANERERFIEYHNRRRCTGRSVRAPLV